MNNFTDILTFDPQGKFIARFTLVKPYDFARTLEKISAEFVLFWDPRLGEPPLNQIGLLTRQPVDVWHAGLKLGMAGLPGTIDFVTPTWMLNRDPDPSIEAASWRLSLRASLIRTDVIRKMGWLHPEFKTIEAAVLEMGHRWITSGVIMRHTPALVSNREFVSAIKLPLEDEIRFIKYRFSRFWTFWARLRAVISGYAAFAEAFRADGKIQKVAKPEKFIPYPHNFLSGTELKNDLANGSVSVLIPTVNRYVYLRKLLDQLRAQTVAPLEIIIVDQTTAEKRDLKLAPDFKDLPLRLLYQDNPGQCSSRNVGLQVSNGDFVLFIDDDDEVPPDIIERHLKNLGKFKCDVSSGSADEVGVRAAAQEKFVRQSDVFPTNNTMIVKKILARSGLFDLAYDQRARADGDLGMRVYLSGAHMILDPSIIVKHHHAPEGGLRTHRARIITYDASRHSLSKHNLMSASEIYLARRYFTQKQVCEMIWMRTAGTFSVWGGLGKRFVKFIISALLLPRTLYKTACAVGEASEILKKFPKIPFLETEHSVKSG